jgi:1,2-diacylglycerol 3-alpha-glucosyltransferase
MRVALFSNNYLPFRGGVASAVETLREELDAQGHEAWVFAPAGSGREEPDRPRVVRYPAVGAPTYAGFSLPLPFSRAATRTAARVGFDVVHAQHPFLLGPAARRLARRIRRPLVFTYHTHYEKYVHYVPLPGRLAAALAVGLSRRFADSADLVVAPSVRVAALLRGRGVRTPVAVVPTGVPLERFSPGDPAVAREACGLPAAGPLCLYVGRLDREKSVGRVIQAFGSIAGGVAGARLLLVGQGAHEGPIRRLAAGSPAAGSISFRGAVPREALPAFYRAADLFLFASETETQGLVLAEAHACGLPAVAVRAPGVDEVVRDGETGVLVKPQAEAVADAAIALLLDVPQRRAMAEAARAQAERAFSAGAQVRVLVGHYERLLGAHR